MRQALLPRRCGGMFRLMARLTRRLHLLAGIAFVGVDIAAQGGPDAWRPQTVPLFGASYSPDIGLLLGAGVSHTPYRFRAPPPSTQLLAEAAYATSDRTYRIDVAVEFRRRDPVLTALERGIPRSPAHPDSAGGIVYRARDRPVYRARVRSRRRRAARGPTGCRGRALASRIATLFPGRGAAGARARAPER